MIIDKTVYVKWYYITKEHYEKLGYIFTKYNDVFEVKVQDLTIGSHINIKCTCDNCGVEKNIKYQTYIKNTKNLTEEYYCKKCNNIKNKKTNLERYGVESPIQNKEIKEKIKKTNLERYGVENPSQNKDVKENKLKTIKNKYCVNNVFQLETIKQKIKQTNLNKYDVEYPLLNLEIYNKAKITILEKYGVEYAQQNEEIKNKIKQTNIKNYGVENPSQNIIIKNERKKTMLEKYGVEYAQQNEEIKNKTRETIFIKYGVNNISQNEEIKEKVFNTIINKYGELFFKYCPKYNPLSLIEFDKISEELNINIQHALNGGEKKFQRYWVDGYIESKNIIIEWDEKQHKYNKLKDDKRQKWIEEKFGCTFIRIEQDKWFDLNLNEKERIYKLLNDKLNL
jgi:hypothetical protein